MEKVISFGDQLKVEGINFKGFGILPKYVMLDPDLSIEAKTIYAYFCSFAGNGSATFPGRDKILSDLPMSKDAYYKHFRQLTDQGYITVEQQGGNSGAIYGKNIYTLVSNPKKFSEKPEDTKHGLAYSRIRFSGLKAAGFGMIPKAVMIDPRLPVKAKGVYAYFCSFTGSGNNAFPKKEKILFHLGIAEKTYYKFYKLLTELNYITAVQRHIDGRLQVNDYYLNDTPNAANAKKKTVLSCSTQDSKKQDTELKIQDSKKQDTELEIQDGKKQDTEKQDTQIQDSKKQDTNKNNSNKNNVLYNHSLNQQPAQPEQIEGARDVISDISYEVETELLKQKKLPYYFKSDPEKMIAAIHFMVEWDTFFPNGYKDGFEQRIYNLFVEALIEMCCADKPMELKGSITTYAKVIDKINQLAKFEDYYVDISEFADPARENYKRAALDQDIRNPMQYMKACIWDAMQTGSIGMYADIARI
ncbi:helix-turn-helix domain-containing protein [Ruthenibacterium lactatiformans]|uniref:helix-turn-helix domain-containing protein n=1 Tax=Ruthenibacterium lactatiformans TaxID=1550024 RepID=UPI0019689869|nr:helix-turn-helix domain-containing protein [Ruthenibacterium lactatiformans]MBN3018105.1 helix-turn-helix domain-containing protein [Ruthenibacterium lactatiformans]